jgi:hypothetical protein
LTHHERGLVWIYDQLGERKILDIHVHRVLRLVPGGEAGTDDSAFSKRSPR